jgi:hypothetical protein
MVSAGLPVEARGGLGGLVLDAMAAESALKSGRIR